MARKQHRPMTMPPGARGRRNMPDAMDPLLDGSAPFDRLPPLEDWAWRGG